MDVAKATRRLTVAILVAIFLLSVAALFLLGADSVPVLSVAIPTMGGLTGAYNHIVSKGRKADDNRK